MCLNIFSLTFSNFMIFNATLRDNMAVKSSKQRFQESKSVGRNINERNSFVFVSERSMLALL